MTARTSCGVGYLAVVDAASSMTVIPGRGASSHRLFNIGPAPGIAEAFTFAKSGGARYGNGDEKPDHTFDDVGFRTAAPGIYDPFQVAEFGISLEQAYESLSDLQFEMDIDTNGDGKRGRRRCWRRISSCSRAIRTPTRARSSRRRSMSRRATTSSTGTVGLGLQRSRAGVAVHEEHRARHRLRADRQVPVHALPSPAMATAAPIPRRARSTSARS